MTTETRPIWISKDGRKFYSALDFEDTHLLNMIPFLAKGIKALDQIKVRLDDDAKALAQRSIDKRLDLTSELLGEIQRRGLELPIEDGLGMERWEKDFYDSFSYYNKPFEN